MRIKLIIDFILFSNIFVAFSFSCLAFQTFYLTNARVEYSLILLIFCSSFFIYSFHRWFGIMKVDENAELPFHLKWIKNHKKQMVLIFMLLVPVIIFSSFKLSLAHVIAMAPLLLISFGYTIPVMGEGGKSVGLREIKGLKIFIIAFVVSCVTVLLPIIFALNEMVYHDSEILFLFIERFLFVFAITIPFDIRDMQFDKLNMTKTIPVMFGEKNAKKVSYLALAACIITGILHFFLGGLGILSLSALISSLLISAIFLFYTSQKRNEYFFSFWMDGMMVLQTMLVLLFGN